MEIKDNMGIKDRVNMGIKDRISTIKDKIRMDRTRDRISIIKDKTSMGIKDRTSMEIKDKIRTGIKDRANTTRIHTVRILTEEAKTLIIINFGVVSIFVDFILGVEINANLKYKSDITLVN